MFSFRSGSNSSRGSGENDDDRQRIQKMIGFMKIQTDERIEEICQITNQEIRSKTKNLEDELTEQEGKNIEKMEQNIKTKYLISSSEISSEQNRKILLTEWQFLDQICAETCSRISQMDRTLKKQYLEQCLMTALQNCDFESGKILCLEQDLEILREIASENDLITGKYSDFAVSEKEFVSEDRICGIQIRSQDSKIVIENSAKLQIDHYVNINGNRLMQKLQS